LNYFYFFEIQNNSAKSKYGQYYMLNNQHIVLPLSGITHGEGNS